MHETQAPKMAPQVAAEELPELDAKVDSFLTALSSTEAVNSPEFAAQAENVRTMGDADIRKAAETSNRMLEQPVRALKEGGIAQGSRSARRCSSCAARSRTSTPARPPAPRSGWTCCPSATRSPTTSASTSRRRPSSTASCTACATARTS